MVLCAGTDPSVANLDTVIRGRRDAHELIVPDPVLEPGGGNAVARRACETGLAGPRRHGRRPGNNRFRDTWLRIDESCCDPVGNKLTLVVRPRALPHRAEVALNGAG